MCLDYKIIKKSKWVSLNNEKSGTYYGDKIIYEWTALFGSIRPDNCIRHLWWTLLDQIMSLISYCQYEFYAIHNTIGVCVYCSFIS